MTKSEALQALTFGQRIAEEEREQLASYFVETDLWRRMLAGEVDIVYGAKGSGKSAIYALLLDRDSAFRERGILIRAAENPRGTPVFKDLVADAPTNENEFRALWKLYILALVVRTLADERIDGRVSRATVLLEQAGLLPREASLRGLVRAALDYARSLLRAESLEGGLRIDPATGLASGFTGKITLREPSSSELRAGLVSVDEVCGWCSDAIRDARLSIWILLDRLDVAFGESDDLERNALRALFRVYLDLRRFDPISLKIFLRSDIWRRITSEGFREASHITRDSEIVWEPRSLLNLVARRVLRSESVRAFYSIADEERVLRDSELQRQLFYRIFPPQVDAGSRKAVTFDWLLSRTRDGSGKTAPRELIHMLTSAREEQIRDLEIGGDEPPGENLLSSESLRAALPTVSAVRVQQTLFAEYPALKPWIEALAGEKTEQTVETLARIWRVTEEEALSHATELVEIGFFERRGARDLPTFWVPFLYRDGAGMVQGAAES